MPYTDPFAEPISRGERLRKLAKDEDHPLGLCRRAMRDRCNTIEDDDPFTLLNPWLHE